MPRITRAEHDELRTLVEEVVVEVLERYARIGGLLASVVLAGRDRPESQSPPHRRPRSVGATVPPGQTHSLASKNRDAIGPGQKYVAVQQVMELLSISKHTVYDMLADGTLESVKIRRSRRITRESLDAYLDGLHGPARRCA